jgi:hypothetical protein
VIPLSKIIDIDSQVGEVAPFEDVITPCIDKVMFDRET